MRGLLTGAMALWPRVGGCMGSLEARRGASRGQVMSKDASKYAKVRRPERKKRSMFSRCVRFFALALVVIGIHSVLTAAAWADDGERDVTTTLTIGPRRVTDVKVTGDSLFLTQTTDSTLSGDRRMPGPTGRHGGEQPEGSLL